MGSVIHSSHMMSDGLCYVGLSFYRSRKIFSLSLEVKSGLMGDPKLESFLLSELLSDAIEGCQGLGHPCGVIRID